MALALYWKPVLCVYCLLVSQGKPCVLRCPLNWYL